MKRKAFVFGLDSASLNLILPLVKSGRLIHISHLIENGCHGILKSTIPPHSAPAWISFMTGENPAKHGVYGFRTYDLSRYSSFNEALVNSSYYRGKTIFDYLSQVGKRVVAFTIPTTYPVWQINGYMIAGYPTPDERKAFTYPDSLAEEIGPLSDIKVDIKLSLSIERQIRSYKFEMQQAINAIYKIFKGEDIDLFVYVNTILDCAQHTLWRYRDPSYPLFSKEGQRRYGHLIDELYIMFDGFIGKIIDMIDLEKVAFFLISDHGAGPRPITYFNTNHFLLTEGYLTVRDNVVRRYLNKKIRLTTEWAREYLPLRNWVKKNLPLNLKENISKLRAESASIVWEETRAYRVPFYYPYEGINLNVRGRQPKGVITPGKEYESIREEIMDKLWLLNRKYSHPLILEVYKKEDIYQGPFLPQAPDIIFKLHEDYESSSGLDCIIEEVPRYLLSRNSGYHRMEGTFIACGPNINRGQEVRGAEMIDIAPTLLYWLGLPVPRNMDGKVLGIFEEDLVKNNRLKYADELKSSYDHTDLKPEEEEDIKRALKGLGYLD